VFFNSKLDPKNIHKIHFIHSYTQYGNREKRTRSGCIELIEKGPDDRVLSRAIQISTKWELGRQQGEPRCSPQHNLERELRGWERKQRREISSQLLEREREKNRNQSRLHAANSREKKRERE
jgi:hypothetical protein